MISARLFRLYRLASPVSISAATPPMKILEPTLRRVAVSRPDVDVVCANSHPFALSWARYCASSTDKGGDAPSADEDVAVKAASESVPFEEAEGATEDASPVAVAPEPEVAVDVAAPVAEEVKATTDSPSAEAQCDESLSNMQTPSDSLDESVDATPSVDSVTTEESHSIESSDPEQPPASTSIDSSTAEAACPPSAPTSLSAAPGLHVHVLSDRAVIRIEGTDTQALLQGLVTQDLELLNHSPSVYAMMLNLQGRVLYDVIIYNVSSPLSEIQKYLLECDAAVAPDIVSHLKKYKLRKNCDIVNVSDVYEVSSVRPTTERMAGLSSLPRKSEFAEAFDPIMMACRDPRLKDIGWRLIGGKGFDVSEALGGGAVARPLIEYREHRYKLGVAEGIQDLEPGKTFPLESNLVFLNGVSFSKGCYLGQELTARTHHTGVIRKRIMPLILSAPISPELGPFPGNLILNTAGKDAGKFRDAVGEHGIGLVRVNMSGGRLIVVGKGKESECYARMPHWWPMDDPAAVLGDEGEEEPVEEVAAGRESAQTNS